VTGAGDTRRPLINAGGQAGQPATYRAGGFWSSAVDGAGTASGRIGRFIGSVGQPAASNAPARRIASDVNKMIIAGQPHTPIILTL
jgi:hypothetical protein